MISATKGLRSGIPLTILMPRDRILWGVFAVIAVILPPWEYATSVTMTGLPQLAAVVAVLLLLRACFAAMRPDFHVLPTLLETGAALIAQTAIIGLTSYLCARNSLPLWNTSFDAADKAMGYDWHAWERYEESSATLSHVLHFAYDSYVGQTFVILAATPFIGDGKGGFRFIRASTIAALVACAGSYALPAAMPEAIHTDWYPHWAALRGTAPFAIDFSDLQGIVTFPSFHASLAVLFVYSMRGLGPVTWAFTGLNGLMIVATTTYGHHYFADVLAGLAVAVGAIVLTRRIGGLTPAAVQKWIARP